MQVSGYDLIFTFGSPMHAFCFLLTRTRFLLYAYLCLPFTFYLPMLDFLCISAYLCLFFCCLLIYDCFFTSCVPMLAFFCFLPTYACFLLFAYLCSLFYVLLTYNCFAFCLPRGVAYSHSRVTISHP